MTKHKNYKVTITVSKLKIGQCPETIRTKQIKWQTEMTKREIRALSQSPAFGADYVEIRVDIEGDPEGTNRTISPYFKGFSYW